jgi:hypothetical protein
MREKNISKKYKYISSPLSGFLLLFLFIGLVYARIERWVYRYNGSGNGDDAANSIVYGADGNIYAAGYSTGNGTAEDFTVVSLTTLGDTNWVYRYNGLGNGGDIAKAVVYGNDGNIYAAGYSEGFNTGHDFTVISLTAAGETNWVYRFNGAGYGGDRANSVVYGTDGNIYAAGYSTGNDSSVDFTVISLTTAGDTNWVYRFDEPGYYSTVARSIVYGDDGNIYAAGDIYFGLTEFTVISVDTTGTQRWFYHQFSAGWSTASSIVYGADNNIYVAGVIMNISLDFTVISIDTAGTRRWVYYYLGPPGFYNDSYGSCIIYGLDGNLYAGGHGVGSGTGEDFIVISLTTVGDTNWVYRYNGPGNNDDRANSIVYGQDGNIYAAGSSCENGSGIDFTIISLTTVGDAKWVYHYNGLGNGNDVANSIVYGQDGNIYAAGYSTGIGTAEDFTVISLDSVLGIEENHTAIHKAISLEAFPNPFSNRTAIRFQMIYNSNVEIGIYDVTGRLIKRFDHLTNSPSNQMIWSGTDDKGNHLPAGVYFVRIASATWTQTIPIILIR